MSCCVCLGGRDLAKTGHVRQQTINNELPKLIELYLDLAGHAKFL